MMRRIYLIALLGIFLTGCAGTRKPIASDRLTIFVPGVAGNGPMYDGLIRSIEKTGSAVEVFKWGSLIMTLNFSDPETHAQAERELANHLVMIPDQVKRIDVIGHSAGCGVVLGAMKFSNRNVQTVVLLAPSVSPGYDLSKSARNVMRIHSFYSDRDITFLKWRTGNFGTYDGIKIPAAGHLGFVHSDHSGKLIQYPYDPKWNDLGNDGRHTGPLAAQFIQDVVLPLLRE